MLRGAIDHVSPSEVGGWIYSANGSLRDHTVLAFIDDVCIGAGRVEVFREDLADAGLGDGFLGFRFPVTIANAEEAPLVSVKLEGSDAVFLQAAARLALRSSPAGPMIITARSQASIEWMRARGWLDQMEFDFLRLMVRFGAYDLNLHKGKPQEKGIGSGLNDPQRMSQHMFELLCAAPVEVSTEIVTPEMGILAQVERFHAGSIGPIIAVWSPQPASISLVEGSHQESPPFRSAFGTASAVDYPIGSDRILFVDLRCRLKSQFGNQVRCYSATVR